MMRVRNCSLSILLGSTLVVTGCDLSENTPVNQPATGGVAKSGGSSGSGGANTGGETTRTGGDTTNNTATGGTTNTGGGANTGGAPAATGGARATGGATSSGGTTNTGGAMNTGGTTNTGGARAGGSASGGTVSSGGAASGGVQATGGTTPAGGVATLPAPTGHYQMEDLGRGVVAVKVTGGVYVGWRMLGYEYDPAKPTAIAYNVYRDGAKIASVTDSTNYLDATGTSSSVYTVTPVYGGAEGARSPEAKPWTQNYVRIPLTPPGSSFEANDASPGDLDGDGEYEIVLKWQPANAKDNSQTGVTDNTFLDGLKLDGTRLWRIDLGKNIRSGAHYTQHSVYDFDGDGKAEIAVKTAPGTKDGKGKFLAKGPAASDDDNADFRNGDGYILTGPEYLTVFSGATGEELATVAFPVVRGTVSSWGDSYGNRVDRFNGGASFVKEGGKATGLPSIIQQRGYYTRMTIGAYTYRGGVLAKNWIYDSGNSGGGYGQGNHSISTADVDGDGAMELIPGASTIGSDGTFKCSTKMDHGDALHVSEFSPGKGIQVFMPHEGKGGFDLHDGATCAIIKGSTGGDDNGRGVAADVDPGSPGGEFWSAKDANRYSAVTGASLGPKPEGQNFLIWWDGDESRELLDGATISKFGGGTLLTASGCSGNNGTKNTPTLVADLLGDWREELVVRETNNTGLRVYTTTAVTKRRLYTLMHDPTYRMQVSMQQASYNQPSHTGFHIGNGMKDPPKPDIFIK